MGKVWSKANKDFSLIFLPFENMKAIGKFLKKKKKVGTRVASNERRLKNTFKLLDILCNLPALRILGHLPSKLMMLVIISKKDHVMILCP